jgi:predicted negative regulator of RcsB-dependent stress response
MAKASEENLTGPDAFELAAASTWSVVEKNMGWIVGLAVALLLAGLGYVAYGQYQEHVQHQAFEALYPVQSEYLKLHEDFDKAKFKSLAPEKADPKKTTAKDDAKDSGKKASGDLQTDYGSVLPGLQKIVQEHPKTAAGAQAALTLSEIYSSYKQYDKAAEALMVPGQNLPSKDLLYALSNMALGNVLASKGDCQKAIDAYQKIPSSKANLFLHADANLKSGVCFESLGQLDKATEMYQKAAQDSDNQSAQSAKTLIRALEFKKSQAAAKSQASHS